MVSVGKSSIQYWDANSTKWSALLIKVNQNGFTIANDRNGIPGGAKADIFGALVGTGRGLAVGLAGGTMTLPGIGTAIGGAGGVMVGLIGGAIGGSASYYAQDFFFSWWGE